MNYKTIDKISRFGLTVLLIAMICTGAYIYMYGTHCESGYVSLTGGCVNE